MKEKMNTLKEKVKSFYQGHSEAASVVTAVVLIGIIGCTGFLLNHNKPEEVAAVEEEQPQDEAKDTTTAADESKDKKEDKNSTKKNESDATAKKGTTKKTVTPATAISSEDKTEEEPQHVHNWVHKDAVTEDKIESRYVVDEPEHDEELVTTVEIADGTEPNENGFPMLTYHTEERVQTIHYPEKGHMEQYVAGTVVLEEGYDYCSECGARK